MEVSQSQDPFTPIIEEVINIKSLNFENQYDETIVLLGPSTSNFLVFAKTFFKNYEFPKFEKKGFKGAFTYMLMTKTGDKLVAYIYETEFYVPNIEKHIQINNSQKLKVLLFTSLEVLEADNDLRAFEYLHKELQSFLTHVRYDHRSVGLIVAAAKTITTNDLIELLMTQAYQDEWLKLFSSRTEQGHFKNLQLLSYTIAQRRLIVMNRPEVVRFISETIQFVGTSKIHQPGAYFYHKHYKTMDGFLQDYNQRLNGLAEMIKTRIVPDVNSLEDTYHGFMDGVLRIQFDSTTGFPLNLLDNLDITLDHHEREFGRHLLDHADLLKGSQHLTGLADPQFRYHEMEFIEHNIARYETLMPKNYLPILIDSIKKMKANIGLMIRLTKVDRKLTSRTDSPSQKLHIYIVKSVLLILDEMDTKLDGYKEKFAILWKGSSLTRFKLTLDLYKAELKFIFANRDKNEQAVTTLNRPIFIFRGKFDVIIEETIEEIYILTKMEIGEGVKGILEMAVNEFLRKHEVKDFKNQTIEKIMQIVQEFKKLKAAIQPLTGEYLPNVHYQEWNASKSTISLDKLKLRITNTHDRFAAYQLMYHNNIWTPCVVVGGICFDKNETDGQLSTTINRHYDDMIDLIADNVVQMLVRNKTNAVDQVVRQLDRHLELGFRHKFVDFKLADAEDWISWRQQTAQTFYRLHSLQEIPQSLYNFTKSLNLLFAIHSIDVPRAEWAELEKLVGVFDEMRTEMDVHRINPISDWGRQLVTSKRYLRNSASSWNFYSTLLLGYVFLRKLIKL